MASFVLRVISLLAILGVAMPAHAEPSFIVGASCNNMDVGTTHMASNKKDIIACLLDDSGNKVWKSMTSGGNGGMCGFLVLSGYDTNRYVDYGPGNSAPPDVTGSLVRTAWSDGQQIGASSPTSVIFNSYCNGSSLISNTGNACDLDCGVQYSGYRLSCPAGYTLQLVSSGPNAIASTTHGQGLGGYTISDHSVYYAGAFYDALSVLPISILASRNFNPNYSLGGYFSTWTCIKD